MDTALSCPALPCPALSCPCHPRTAAGAAPGRQNAANSPDPDSAVAQWKFCPFCEFSSQPAVPRCLAQAAALSSPEIVRKEHPWHGNEAAGAGRVSAAHVDLQHPALRTPPRGAFKAFPAPSTSCSHQGSPAEPRTRRSSRLEVEAERELTALSWVLFCSPRRAPAGLCQLTGSLNIARESGFASGAVNRVTRNEKEYL